MQNTANIAFTILNMTYILKSTPIPHILIVLLIVVSSVAIAVLLFKLILSKIDKTVLQHSSRIKRLLEINQTIDFSTVKNQFCLTKKYDNKSSFYKVEPQYLMSADLRANIDYYTRVIDLIRRNQLLYPNYIDSVNKITSEITKAECRKLKLPYCIFKKRENIQFNKNILSPAISVEYTVKMHYSSPKGRVNEYKQCSFSMSDMMNAMESVSRSKLDYATYKKLAAVERAEVSDEMRYNILCRDGFKCVICGASAKEGAHLHVDHILPISKGGKSTFDNLRTLCERCNIGKSNKIEIVKEKDNAHIKSTNTRNFCPQCGAPLILRNGKYGEFYGCSSFPNCKYTTKIDKK